MSGSKQRQYRRAVNRNYDRQIKKYVVGICKEKFLYRWRFASLILRKRNPHTGEKVK